MYDKLLGLLSGYFSALPDHRTGKTKYSLRDSLMASFAMFALKDPSLLSFVSNYAARAENLKEVFDLERIPSENGLRKILDRVEPSHFRGVFAGLLEHLSQQGYLSNRYCLDKRLLVSIDGTGSYSSNKIGCQHCLTKKHRDGKVEHHHQLLAASLVTPGLNTVFPVYAEAITQQDGRAKNDCERKACKRLLPQLREVLPAERLVILLDALYADGPTIRALVKQEMDYIIVIKEGYVLEQVQRMVEKGTLQQWQWQKDAHTLCRFEWTTDLILNGAHQDISVNYLSYQEYDVGKDKVVYANQWITNLDLTRQQLYAIAQAGRARWKIENETFNTLKNQGYNLEHNYGHGQWYLSTVMALIMLLAFFIDQITKAYDQEFEHALLEAKTLRDLRQKVRVLFDFIPTKSMKLIYQIIARKVNLIPQLE
jgi:hypothetical protein